MATDPNTEVSTQADTPRPRTLDSMLHRLQVERDFQGFKELWTFARAWPPDAYAISYLLLSSHASYRTAVCTDEVADFQIDRGDGPMSKLWPNMAEFSSYVRTIGAQWRRYADDVVKATRDNAAPPAAQPTLAAFFAEVENSLCRLVACAADYTDATCQDRAVLFCMSAAADEACVGLGLPGPAAGSTTWFALEAELRLVDIKHGSLSRFSPHAIRVLPKMHTPQRGMTLRSLSHHVCATTQEFGLRWMVPSSLEDAQERRSHPDERLNLLLFPWPLTVTDQAVRPAPKSLPGPWGYFDWVPSDPFDVGVLSALLKSAIRRNLTVDGVVLPEASITEPEAEALFTELDQLDVKLVLAGIRGEATNAAWLHTPGSFTFEQGKHHRWCLDRGQIEQYSFQRVLNPHIQWWENIRLAPRTLGFVALSSWLTLCHVICEDLARLDPVDQIIRAVGPNLLIALLQDGPQLRQRWGARYATVYSDDPGTSVLTLTSKGMAMASRPPPGGRRRPVVALWSDPDTGTRELELEDDAEALWISICARRVVEFAADGRSDGGMASRLTLVDHQSIWR